MKFSSNREAAEKLLVTINTKIRPKESTAKTAKIRKTEVYANDTIEILVVMYWKRLWKNLHKNLRLLWKHVRKRN